MCPNLGAHHRLLGQDLEAGPGTVQKSLGGVLPGSLGQLDEVLDQIPPCRRPPIDPAHQPCCLRAARRFAASARIAV